MPGMIKEPIHWEFAVLNLKENQLILFDFFSSMFYTFNSPFFPLILWYWIHPLSSVRSFCSSAASTSKFARKMKEGASYPKKHQFLEMFIQPSLLHMVPILSLPLAQPTGASVMLPSVLKSFWLYPDLRIAIRY